jgi:hypothetical protein
MTIAVDVLDGKISMMDLGNMVFEGAPNPADRKKAGTQIETADPRISGAINESNVPSFEAAQAFAKKRAAEQAAEEEAKKNKTTATNKSNNLNNLSREELKARRDALVVEMNKITTTKENSKAEREAHNKRIDEINKETAKIVERQQQKGWVEPDKPVAPKANPKPGKVKGGISTGPMSGYQETLHGTEAVVPLPDNKSIPVTLDSSSLNKQIAHQTSILNEILVAMRDGNKYASGLLRNSY